MKPQFRTLVLVMSLFVVSAPAHAQLRLPSLPSLPRLPDVTPALRRDVPSRVAELMQSRQRRIAELLRQRSDAVESDPAGEPVLRGEVVLTSPSDALLASARSDGFTFARERILDALDLRLVTLRAPPGWDTRRALQRKDFSSVFGLPHQ